MDFCAYQLTINKKQAKRKNMPYIYKFCNDHKAACGNHIFSFASAMFSSQSLCKGLTAMSRKRRFNLLGMRMLRTQWRGNWQSIHLVKTIRRSEDEAMSAEQQRVYECIFWQFGREQAVAALIQCACSEVRATPLCRRSISLAMEKSKIARISLLP